MVDRPLDKKDLIRQLELSKFWGRAADCIIYPELHSTLEWQGAQVSDLSHVLIHHTNDW